MLSKKSVLVKNQIQSLLLQLEVNQLNLLLESYSELLLFLARYSFLFDDSSESVNSCTPETAQSLVPQAFWERPLTFLDPDGLEVDYAFIRSHEGAAVLNGYVPQKKDGTVIGKSGVTIASGFDLGQQNSYDLNRIFGSGNTNKTLKDLFTPYLGKQKDDAKTYLAENPLSITEEQAATVDECVMAQMLPSIKKQYEKATSGKWDDLPDQAQTTLFDLGYQFGQNSGIPSDVMTKIKEGNYSGAAGALEEMGKNAYKNRRNDEAALLKQLQNTNTEGQ